MKLKSWTRPLAMAMLVVLVVACWFIVIAGIKSSTVRPDLVPHPQPAPVIPIVVP